jgi:hypothetical protein
MTGRFDVADNSTFAKLYECKCKRTFTSEAFKAKFGVGTSEVTYAWNTYLRAPPPAHPYAHETSSDLNHML